MGSIYSINWNFFLHFCNKFFCILFCHFLSHKKACSSRILFMTIQSPIHYFHLFITFFFYFWILLFFFHPIYFQLCQAPLIWACFVENKKIQNSRSKFFIKNTYVVFTKIYIQAVLSLVYHLNHFLSQKKLLIVGLLFKRSINTKMKQIKFF